MHLNNKNKKTNKTPILYDCHYHHKSSKILAAISFCDNTVVCNSVKNFNKIFFKERNFNTKWLNNCYSSDSN